jgi:hypothetical protein
MQATMFRMKNVKVAVIRIVMVSAIVFSKADNIA